jgi:TnpA family transposase
MTWGEERVALERAFTLLPDDFPLIHGARGLPQRLERALILSWMRVEHALVTNVTTLPAAVIAYVAQQLDLTADVLAGYRSHQQTRTEAAQAIRTHLAVRPFAPTDRARLTTLLANRVAHTGHTTALTQTAEDWLVREGILRPTGETTMTRLVYAARVTAERHLFVQIAGQLSTVQVARLDALCQTEGQDSPLAHLVAPPRKPSAKALCYECDRLRAIRSVLVDDLDWGEITMNRRRQWAAIVRRLSAQALRRYDAAKRYTHLLAYLIVRAEELTNGIVEMFDLLVGRVFAQSDQQVGQTKVQRANFLQESARHLRRVAEIVTDDTIPDGQVRAALLRYLPRERWREQRSLSDAFERGEVDVLFSLLGRRFTHVRQFAPAVLTTLRLDSPRMQNPLLAGLHMLEQLAGKTGRAAQIPTETTVDFVPAKWKSAVAQPTGINRQAWELTLLHEVRNGLRSGDLTVAGSHRYAAWDTDLYTREAWAARRDAWYAETGLPADGAAYVAQLRAELDHLTHAVAGRIPRQNTAVQIAREQLVLTPLEKRTPSPAVEQARHTLLTPLPHPGLPDLLQEVDRWTHFTDAFFHLTPGRPPSPDYVAQMRPALFAALIAEGTNLGLATMAGASGIREDQLQRAVDWYLREETIRAAITRLIQYQRSLPLADKFGDGTTASSDGIRFGVAPSALLGRHHPRYFGMRRGVTLISHVSDQGSQFWIDVVNCQVRESTYVLDGLVYQDTFPIQEHYTDTGGFTELVFGCFELLGFRFAPRIRDLPDQVLYRLDRTAHYGALDPILRRTIRAPLIVAHWDDMNRMAASFRDGLATPSVVIAKLQARPRQNPIQQAIQELGRIGKTRHILQYIDDEAFRRRVLDGLNKGEALHALARVLFFGQQGRFMQREYETQLNRATALSLLINAIVVWNTRYLGAVAEQVGPLTDDLWPHLSPVRWEHILIVGKYSFEDLQINGALRPLRFAGD